MSEKYLGLIPFYDCKTGEKGVRSAGAPLTEASCRDQRLVDIFVDMGAPYREIWLTHPVMFIKDVWRNTRDVGVSEPDTVRIEFLKGPALQYTSRTIVCDIASALQECSNWKPSDVMADYLLKHRKVEHIVMKAVINRDGASFDDIKMNADGNIRVLTSDETARHAKDKCLALLKTAPGTRIAEPDIGYDAIYSTDVPNDKPTRFSDAPFKVIRDYLYACSFLSPYAPGFTDYANDLLAYRLSYAISQEKDLSAREAISNLAHNLNSFAKNHADGAWGLRASTKVELFSGAILPALTVRSDFGIITVQYEPELTMLDWENRYAALRTRHG